MKCNLKIFFPLLFIFACQESFKDYGTNLNTLKCFEEIVVSNNAGIVKEDFKNEISYIETNVDHYLQKTFRAECIFVDQNGNPFTGKVYSLWPEYAFSQDKNYKKNQLFEVGTLKDGMWNEDHYVYSRSGKRFQKRLFEFSDETTLKIEMEKDYISESKRFSSSTISLVIYDSDGKIIERIFYQKPDYIKYSQKESYDWINNIIHREEYEKGKIKKYTKFNGDFTSGFIPSTKEVVGNAKFVDGKLVKGEYYNKKMIERKSDRNYWKVATTVFTGGNSYGYGWKPKTVYKDIDTKGMIFWERGVLQKSGNYWVRSGTWFFYRTDSQGNRFIDEAVNYSPNYTQQRSHYPKHGLYQSFITNEKGNIKIGSKWKGFKVSEGNYFNNKKNGRWYYFNDSNGKLKGEVTYYDGERIGPYKYYHQNGQVAEIGNYHTEVWQVGGGRKNYVNCQSCKKGEFLKYWDNGNLQVEGEYKLVNPHFDKDSIKTGKWKFYNKKGQLTKTECYSSYKSFQSMFSPVHNSWKNYDKWYEEKIDCKNYKSS